MDQARRPLTGMEDGFPVTVAEAPASSVLHTFDAAPAGDSNGRPAVDVLTLFLQNHDAAAATNVTLVIAGVTIVVAVPIGGILQVFDEQPFGLPANAPGGQTLEANIVADEGPVVAWGWFVRTQG